jgi:hypothetical protein
MDGRKGGRKEGRQEGRKGQVVTVTAAVASNASLHMLERKVGRKEGWKVGRKDK